MKSFIELFKQRIDEIHTIHDDIDVYLLPTDINANSYYGKYNSNVAEEVVKCIKDCISKYPERFIFQPRPKNLKTLKYLGLDIKSKNAITIALDEFLSVLTFSDFDSDTTERRNRNNYCTAYVFIIKNFKERIPMFKNCVLRKKDIYLKFEFLYDIKKDGDEINYIGIKKDKHGNLFVMPNKLYLNEISLHG